MDVLIHSLDEAESLVRKYESRLSEEDIVPADTTAIKNLREQQGVRDTKKKQINLFWPDSVNVNIFDFFIFPEVAGRPL